MYRAINIICENRSLFIKTVREKQANPTTTLIAMVDGINCETKIDLLTEFSKALQFPEYFGCNWDAFDECVNDLSWINKKKIIIVLLDAQLLLRNQENDYKIFLETLHDINESLIKKEVIIFHHVDLGQEDILEKRLEKIKCTHARVDIKDYFSRLS